MNGNPPSASSPYEDNPPHGTQASTVSAYFHTEFDTQKRRLTAHYLGFWDADIAHKVLTQFRFALERAAGPKSQPFTLLDDCSKWELQSQEVADLAYQFAPMCGEFPLLRNAMIISSSLIRMQVRRTLTNFDICEVFENYERADAWLAEVERPVAG